MTRRAWTAVTYGALLALVGAPAAYQAWEATEPHRTALRTATQLATGPDAGAALVTAESAVPHHPQAGAFLAYVTGAAAVTGLELTAHTSAPGPLTAAGQQTQWTFTFTGATPGETAVTGTAERVSALAAELARGPRTVEVTAVAVGDDGAELRATTYHRTAQD